MARGSMGARAEPVYQQLTFDRGRIGGARFARSEAAIVYSQALGIAAPEVRLVLAGSPESRTLGHREADVLATRPGELALSIHRRYIGGERFSGTLAVVPLNGGTPKELMLDVEDGDWDPSGTDFAVARSTGFGADSWLEYPAGTRLYKARAPSTRCGSPRMASAWRSSRTRPASAPGGGPHRPPRRHEQGAHPRLGQRARTGLVPARRRGLVHRRRRARQPGAARGGPGRPGAPGPNRPAR